MIQYMRLAFTTCFIFLAFITQTDAQAPADTSLHLADAVQLAATRYHLLLSQKLEADAAAKHAAAIRYTKTPSIDASYQAGIGTANNLTGIFYPNGMLPMTGPPSTSNRYDPGTGSAASLLLNWQLATFGQRDADIDAALADANAKRLAWQHAAFQHKIKVIGAYLDLLLSYDVVAINKKNIERTAFNLRQSRVLATTGLKPGLDTALFLSELSKAKTGLLHANEQVLINQSILQQLIVLQSRPVPADTAFLTRLPAAVNESDTSFVNAPLIKAGQGLLLLSQAKETALRKSYLPKLTMWATGFARGSAFQANGDLKTWDGLGLARYNYGAGIQLAFPLLKYGEAKRQIQQQQLLTSATMEKIADDKLALSTQQAMAITTFNSSRAIALETENQLRSGQYAFGAMQLRYNTGLVNFADLIQSQYTLLQAELDVKRAYWDNWKSLLLQAAISGDENIFLQQIR